MTFEFNIDFNVLFSSLNIPTPLDIENGAIYFGGLPKHYQTARAAIATNAYFTGCISDVTLNEEITNFAKHVERQSGVIDVCPDGILGRFMVTSGNSSAREIYSDFHLSLKPPLTISTTPLPFQITIHPP